MTTQTGAPHSGELLAAALGYATLRLPVLPLHTPAPTGCSCRHGAHCDRPGKHPRTPHGLDDASTEPTVIRTWWRHWPDANVGIRTGVLADVADVDDVAGVPLLQKLLGDLVGTVPLARTGSGGWHVFLASTGGGNRGKGEGFLPGVDWRGARGYVVVPPSLHASGARYLWIRSLVLPLPAIPEALRALVLGERPTSPARPAVPRRSAISEYAGSALRREAYQVASCSRGGGEYGGRNHTLNRAAFNLGQLVATGLLDEAEVSAVLTAAALAAGLTAAETARTIRSGLTAGMRRPRTLGRAS